MELDDFVASGDARMVEDDHTDIDRFINNISDARAIIDNVFHGSEKVSSEIRDFLIS